MNALELKVPPVPLALVFAGVMRLAAVQFPALAVALPWRLALALALGVAGGVFALAGMAAFRRARTTFSPMQPGAAAAVVTSGVYRLTRNPMYLGLLLAPAGWAAYLAHVLAFLFLPAFVAYMNRFQIVPEERALASKFDAGFAAYKESVPRWL